VEVDSILSDVVYLEERNNRSFENRERTVGGVKSFLLQYPIPMDGYFGLFSFFMIFFISILKLVWCFSCMLLVYLCCAF
jgi:hypothetical protein